MKIFGLTIFERKKTGPKRSFAKADPKRKLVLSKIKQVHLLKLMKMPYRQIAIDVFGGQVSQVWVRDVYVRWLENGVNK